MSRYNIFKVVREVFREFKGFGNEEIATLKKQLEEQKKQLEKLKVARQERLRREEALTLSELRRAVESLEHMDVKFKHHEKMLTQTADELERKAKMAMEATLQHKASEIVSSIDYGRLLSGDVDVEALLEAQQRKVGAGQQAQQGGGGGGTAAGAPGPQKRGRQAPQQEQEQEAVQQPKAGSKPGA